MLLGSLQQGGEAWDPFFSEPIRNHLFEINVGDGGLDLVALNLQRGRDHGLAGTLTNAALKRSERRYFPQDITSTGRRAAAAPAASRASRRSPT